MSIIEQGQRDPEQLLLKLGFTDLKVKSINTTDGLRLTLTKEMTIHLRPSGNAPELRCYAEATSFDIAKMLVDSVLLSVQQL